MNGPLLHCGWANLRQQPRRTLAALAGITFAVLLVFMQLGFLAGARRGITQVLDTFDFDVAIVSDRFQTLGDRERFDRARLLQAAIVPGVAFVAPLSLAQVAVRDGTGREVAVAQLIGVPLHADSVRQEEIRALLPSLEGGTTVLLDAYSRPQPDARVVGHDVVFNRTLLRVTGLYTMGAALYAEGAAMIDHEALWRVAGFPPRAVDFGLVRLHPGSRAEDVARALQAALPRDVLVLTRAELIDGQQDYFVRVKPVGIAFQIGALVAVIAAAAVLYQVLATDVAARLRDYATLKAMGFSTAAVQSIALVQGLLYAVLGFVPGAVMAAAIFAAARHWTHVPVALDATLGAQTFGLTLAACGVATLLALSRVRRAAPADLFA